MLTLLTLVALIFSLNTFSQNSDLVSEGPFKQLILRGAILINGNGAPPVGPVDITVEKDKITAIVMFVMVVSLKKS